MRGLRVVIGPLGGSWGWWRLRAAPPPTSDGNGIGVCAPQYGPRRGYFAGVSKKF